MNSSYPMELDDLISAADPALHLPPPDAFSAQARWTYSQVTHTRPRWGQTVVRLRPVLAVVMALGLVIAVGALVVGTHRATPAAGAVALRHAADLVAEHSTLQPGPGQYLYTETRSLYQVTIFQNDISSGSSVPVADAQYFETEKSWSNAEGQGSGLLTRSPLEFPSASDQTAWDATTAGPAFSGRFLPSVTEPSLLLESPNVSGLSTDPVQLAAQLASGFGGTNVDMIPNGRSAIFQRAARLLVGPDIGMTPALAAALYRVMADQPGVSLVGSTTDHSGRTGTEVSESLAHGTSGLIIDPTSGSLLETQFSRQSVAPSSSSGGATIQCLAPTGCSSVPTQLVPEGTVIIVGPVWTDSVTSRIVAADGATAAATSGGT